MSNPTPAEIAEAKEWAKATQDGSDVPTTNRKKVANIGILFAALEAAQLENLRLITRTIELVTERDALTARATRAEARCKELEKAVSELDESKKEWLGQAFEQGKAARKLESYVAKLKAAGSALRNYKPDSNPMQAETDLDDIFEDWDAAIDNCTR